MCAEKTKDENRTEEFDIFIDKLDKILEEKDGQDYTPEVVREFRNPSNIGRLPESNGVGVADGICGDSMEIYVIVENEVVQECNFFTDGCGPTIACGSMLTQMVKGLTLDNAMKITPEELDSALGGLPADHKHCAALSILALRNALRDYLKNLENDSKNKKVRK